MDSHSTKGSDVEFRGQKVERYTFRSHEFEIHLFPSGVAACWHIKFEKRQVTQDGVVFKATVPVVSEQKPYITFASVREYDEDDFAIAEDSPAEGGFQPAYALALAKDLQLVCEYIEYINLSVDPEDRLVRLQSKKKKSKRS